MEAEAGNAAASAAVAHAAARAALARARTAEADLASRARDILDQNPRERVNYAADKVLVSKKSNVFLGKLLANIC